MLHLSLLKSAFYDVYSILSGLQIDVKTGHDQLVIYKASSRLRINEVVSIVVKNIAFYGRQKSNYKAV